MVDDKINQLQEIKEVILKNIRANLKTSLKNKLIENLEIEIKIEESLSQHNVDDFKQLYLFKIEQFKQVETDLSPVTLTSLNNPLTKKFDIIYYKLADFYFSLRKNESSNKKEYEVLYIRAKDFMLELFETKQNENKHQIVKEKIVDLLDNLLESEIITDINNFYNGYMFIFNLIINVYQYKNLKNTFYEVHQFDEASWIEAFPKEIILAIKRIFYEIISELDKKIIYQYLLTQISILNRNSLSDSIIASKFNNSFINFCIKDEDISLTELKFALLLVYQIIEKVYNETQDGLKKKLSSWLNKMITQTSLPHLDFLKKYREILGYDIEEEIKELQLIPVNLCIHKETKNSDLQENKEFLDYFFIETIYRSSSERLLKIFYASLEVNKEILETNGLPSQKPPKKLVDYQLKKQLVEAPKKLSEKIYFFSEEIQRKYSSNQYQLPEQFKKTSEMLSEQTHMMSDGIQQKFSNVKKQLKEELLPSLSNSLYKKNIEKEENDLVHRIENNSTKNKIIEKSESFAKYLGEKSKNFLASEKKLPEFLVKTIPFFQANNPTTLVNNPHLKENEQNNSTMNLSFSSLNKKMESRDKSTNNPLSQQTQKELIIQGEGVLRSVEKMMRERFWLKKFYVISFAKKIFNYGCLSKKRTIKKLGAQLKNKLILNDERNFFLHKNFWSLLINYGIIRWPWLNKDIFLTNWSEQVFFLKAAEIIDLIKDIENNDIKIVSQLFEKLIFLYEKLEKNTTVNKFKQNKPVKEFNVGIVTEKRNQELIRNSNHNNYFFCEKPFIQDQEQGNISPISDNQPSLIN